MTDPAVIQQHLVSTLARRLRIQPDAIDPAEQLTRYGLDSLEAEEVMAEMERFLGVGIPDDLPFEHPTVSELVEALRRLVVQQTT